MNYSSISIIFCVLKTWECALSPQNNSFSPLLLPRPEKQCFVTTCCQINAQKLNSTFGAQRYMDEKYHEMWINNVQIISAITHLFTNTTKVNRTNGHGLGVPNKDGRPIQVSSSQKPSKETTYYRVWSRFSKTGHFLKRQGSLRTPL